MPVMLGTNVGGANRTHRTRDSSCRACHLQKARGITMVWPAPHAAAHGPWAMHGNGHQHNMARSLARPILGLLARVHATGDQEGSSASSRQGLDDAPAGSVLSDSPYFWKSVLTRRMNLEGAVEEAVKRIMASSPPGLQPELAIVWVSSAFAEKYEQLVPELRKHVPSLRTVYGCTGFGVVGEAEGGGACEMESVPALSLTLAHMPGVTLSVAHVAMNDLPDGDAPPSAWAQLLHLPRTSPAFSEAGESTTSLVVVADPSFLRLQELLVGLDYALPHAPVIGGLASAGAMSPVRAMWAWSADDAAAAEEEMKSAAAAAHAAAAAAAVAAATAAASATQAGPAAKEEDGRSTLQEASSEVEDGGEGPSSALPPPPPAKPDQRAARAKEGAERVARVSGVWRTGACVLAIQGGVMMELVVAQGCRPLSSNAWVVESMTPESARVTALRHATTGQVVSPLDALSAELRHVAADEAQLREMLRNLTLGIAPETLTSTSSPSSSGSSSSSSGEPEVQEFLIRAMGLDRSGAIAVGDNVRLGQRLRFMVRDERGAREDLAAHGTSLKRRALAASLMGTPLPAPFATLMFSCNGRGTNLYSEPSFDARTVSSYLPVPISGFLANGEIGKVGGTTHLHGFTCAVGVLRVAPNPSGAEPGTASTQGA